MYKIFVQLSYKFCSRTPIQLKKNQCNILLLSHKPAPLQHQNYPPIHLSFLRRNVLEVLFTLMHGFRFVSTRNEKEDSVGEKTHAENYC